VVFCLLLLQGLFGGHGFIFEVQDADSGIAMRSWPSCTRLECNWVCDTRLHAQGLHDTIICDGLTKCAGY
jgi:hypothetical protein